MKKIESCYQNVPYHNIEHAVDVLTAVEVLMNQVEAINLAKFTIFERVTCLLAAACHDIGHPGVTADHIMKNYHDNNFNLTQYFKLKDHQHQTQNQEKTQDSTAAPSLNLSELSKGMLERYHSSVALNIMREYGLDISFNQNFIELFDNCIMATDMSRHAHIVSELKKLSESRQAPQTEAVKTSTTTEETKKDTSINQTELNIVTKPLTETERLSLLPIILHIADLSNPAKDFEDARKWADKVCVEFFQQGDIERLTSGEIGTGDRLGHGFGFSRSLFC